jgi:RNA polymerase sigma factor (sigma-70 family)
MSNVIKDMVSSAPAMTLPLDRAGKQEDDRALVRECQSGVQRAFEELVRRHQQRVFALVGGILRRPEDVEDVAQQVFLKAYLGIKKFDQRAAFSTWLYKIAVNECWDYLRKKKVRPLVYEADLSEEQVSRLDGIVSLTHPPEGPAGANVGYIAGARPAVAGVERDVWIFGAGAGGDIEAEREYSEGKAFPGARQDHGYVSPPSGCDAQSWVRFRNAGEGVKHHDR